MAKQSFLIIFLLVSLHSFAQEPRVLVHDKNITVKPMDVLNTEFRETNLSVTPDGRYIYFMSDRGGMPWTDEKNLQVRFKKKGYDGNIWFSKRSDNGWSQPEPVKGPVNTPRGEDEPVISPDGQTVFFQSWREGWQDSDGPYFKASLLGDEWANETGLGDSIAIFFRKLMARDLKVATDGMTISPDGNTFLVAYSPDYQGKMDILMSKKNSKGRWGSLKKIDLDTPADERSIFMAADGKTIYFASDGYGGFGGLDIFKTTIDENGKHGEIINIGKPFNTEKDDYGFIITASGNKAYFVREGDIYSCDLSDASSQIKPQPIKLFSGRLIDGKGNKRSYPIKLKNKKNNSYLVKTKTKTTTGEFLLISPEGFGDYELESWDDNGILTTTPISLKNDSVYEEINLDYKYVGDKPKLESLTILITVNFDYDKDILKDQYKAIIDSRLASYPNEQIKSVAISGYTDGDGSIAYNQKLGERRAKTVASYLKSKTIQADKLVSFGKLKPIASNKTDDGKSINRRVEIRVTYEFVKK